MLLGNSTDLLKTELGYTFEPNEDEILGVCTIEAAKGCRICRLCTASSIQTFPLIQSPLVKGSFQHLWGDALVRGCSKCCALCRTQMAQTGYRVLQTRKLKSAGGWQENWFAWSKLIKRKRYSLLLLFESVPLFPDVSLSESSSCLKEMV